MYLLDSSAWLAHLLGEPGMEQVNELFDEPQVEINISALSILEIYARLRGMGQEEQWPAVWKTYALLFTHVLPADEAVALQSIALRSSTSARVPTVDSLIAATAAVHQLTLVHRDPHLAAIPAHLLQQRQLPDKRS